MTDKIPWYRTPIDKEVLRELTRRGDLPGLAQSLAFLAIFAAGLYFSWFFFARRMWLPMIVVGYAHCVFTNFLGIHTAIHELSHSTP